MEETKISNKTVYNKIQFNQIRRAQSDITFELFEKLIKKHRLKSTLKDECESDEDKNTKIMLPSNMITGGGGIYDQYYEEVDNNNTKNKILNNNNKQSDWTLRLQLKYKADSKSLDEKINRCFSTGVLGSSLMTGAKSFHNLMFNDFNNSNSSSITTNNLDQKSKPAPAPV